MTDTPQHDWHLRTSERLFAQVKRLADRDDRSVNWMAEQLLAEAVAARKAAD